MNNDVDIYRASIPKRLDMSLQFKRSDLMLTTITTLSALPEISMITIEFAHQDIGSKRIAQPGQCSLFLQLLSDGRHVEVEVGSKEVTDFGIFVVSV